MGMIPEVDDVTIKLPVTFDNSKVTKESTFVKIVTAVGSVIATVIISILILRSKKPLPIKLLIVIGIVIAVSWVLRFKVFKESVYSDAWETLNKCNCTPSTRAFWGIYDVTKTYPYTAHFVGGNAGSTGIFVRLEKGVTRGNTSDAPFKHYDALSDAYNLVGKSNINISHIDYMDNIGNDDRMDILYGELSRCKNEELHKVVSGIYGNLQNIMSYEHTSYDVYCFRGNMTDESLWYSVRAILEKATQRGKSNYVSYSVLDLEELRRIAMSLLNLKNFSALEACTTAFDFNKSLGINPIEIMKASGEVIKLGETVEELLKKKSEDKQSIELSKKSSTSESTADDDEDFSDLF